MTRSHLYLMVLAIAFAGCTNSGAFIAANQTIVNLNEGNYSVKVTDVQGEAEAGFILGLSYSNGLTTSTLAIARVNGTDKLYAAALENLWGNYADDHGSIDNEKLALVNVRYDADILNLVLYTKVKVTVRADVIEFE